LPWLQHATNWKGEIKLKTLSMPINRRHTLIMPSVRVSHPLGCCTGAWHDAYLSYKQSTNFFVGLRHRKFLGRVARRFLSSDSQPPALIFPRPNYNNQRQPCWRNNYSSQVSSRAGNHYFALYIYLHKLMWEIKSRSSLQDGKFICCKFLCPLRNYWRD